MKKNKLKQTFLCILCLLSSKAYPERNIKINTVTNSNIIIGNNNTQNITYTMTDQGVEVYLDVTEGKAIHEMAFFPDGNVGCTKYLEQNSKDNSKYFFPTLTGCVESKNTNYLHHYINNSKVKMLEYAYLPWSFKIKSPVLDLRIINNKAKSLSIKKININVLKSQAYSKPIVFLWHNDLRPMSLMVNNEGNTSIREIEVQHCFSNSLSKSNCTEKYQKVFTFKNSDTINKEDTENTEALDFSESLKMEGIDVDYLRSRKVFDIFSANEDETKTDRINIFKALGKYSDTFQGYRNGKKIRGKEFFAYISGTMKIKGVYNSKPVEKIIAFEGKIPLTAPIHAYGNFSVGQTYDIRLNDNGENYTISLDAPKYLKPFEAERFLLRTTSFESGHHTLSIDVIFSDDSYAKSNKIKLFNWSPRTKRKTLISSNHKSYEELLKTTLASGNRLNVINVKPNDVLNIREKPTHKSKIIGSFAYNSDDVTSSGKIHRLDKSLWISAFPNSFNRSQEGWVNSKYLTFRNYYIK